MIIKCRCLFFLYYGCFFAPSSIAAFGVTPPQQNPTTVLFFTDNDHDDNTLVTNTIQPSWQTILDINQDGKVDGKDFTCLLTKVFDVNGDGKVDGKDAQTALGMTLLSWILMASPAYAKGGGGHSSMSSRGSSNSHSYQYAPYRRRGKNEINRSFSPLAACSSLPLEGEDIDVLVDAKSGTYRPGVAQDIEPNDCRFQAKIVDDRVLVLTTHPGWMDWIVPSFVGACVVDANAKQNKRQEWNEEFDYQVRIEQESSDGNDAVLPQSGLYYGETTESDGAVQEVATTLKFSKSGTVTGHGYDATDGSYTVQGSWSNHKVQWTEIYDDFTVTVRGIRNPHNGLSCRFQSTKGVHGQFQLRS